MTQETIDILDMILSDYVIPQGSRSAGERFADYVNTLRE